MYPCGDHQTKQLPVDSLQLVAEVRVLLVSQIVEGEAVRDLLVVGSLGSVLGAGALLDVPAREEDAHEDEDEVEEDVEAEVGGEAVLVAGGVGVAVNRGGKNRSG
jgi:hypothetical protein